MTNSPNSLYVHVPFCRTKCPYCAFYSFRASPQQTGRWCAAVITELGRIGGELTAPLSTIYIGGGTPSVLPFSVWRRFGSALERLPRNASCEFTAEANPESLTPELVSLWRAIGVNRVSIGVQSLDDAELRTLRRPHTADMALRAIELCQRAGFRVSGDLMFGLPGQALRTWHGSMERLCATGITHISVYQLTLEERSLWGRRPPEGLPDGYPMYRWAQYYLPRKGLVQYEIASFAAEGDESRHNLAYWRRTNVYAAGPAAWGYLNGQRFANARPLAEWADRIERGESAVTFEETLTGERAASEAAILALRTKWGIDEEEFAARYGRAALDDIMVRLEALPPHYIARGNGHTALTPRGMRVGNAIWAELLPR